MTQCEGTELIEHSWRLSPLDVLISDKGDSSEQRLPTEMNPNKQLISVTDFCESHTESETDGVI